MYQSMYPLILCTGTKGLLQNLNCDSLICPLPLPPIALTLRSTSVYCWNVQYNQWFPMLFHWEFKKLVFILLIIGLFLNLLLWTRNKIFLLSFSTKRLNDDSYKMPLLRFRRQRDTVTPWHRDIIDTVTQLYRDTMTPWYHDTVYTVTPWRHYTLTPWHRDTLDTRIPWHCDTVTPWYLDIMTPLCLDTMTSWHCRHRDTIKSWHHDTSITWYHYTLTPWSYDNVTQ